MTDTATEAEREAGQGYETLFVPALFRPWTHHVLNGAGVDTGARVLDIACGTGVLARDALARTGPKGAVAGLDPAPGMIATARAAEPAIDWRLGPAEDLPFDDASFDCVLSQFGMMFFQNLPKAAREMHRVLAPSGRLAVAVWDSVERNPAYGAVGALLDATVSAEAGHALRLPYALGDPWPVITALADAGFSHVEVATRSEKGRFPSARTMIEAELRGWLPLFDIHMDETRIAEVLAQADDALAAYTTPTGEVAFPTSAHIVTARKP